MKNNHIAKKILKVIDIVFKITSIAVFINTTLAIVVFFITNDTFKFEDILPITICIILMLFTLYSILEDIELNAYREYINQLKEKDDAIK